MSSKRVLPISAVLIFAGLFFAVSPTATAQNGSKGTALPPPDATRFLKEKKLALIIGVNAYQEESGLSQLKYAVNDAQELAKALQSYGYVTDVLTDSRALKVTIRRHLEDMLKRVEENSGTILFAFSGHGGQVGKEQYLATYDASAESLDQDGLSVDWIRDRLAEAKAPRKMMFLDACRNVTSPGGKDTVAPISPLQKLAGAKGLRMLISTGPDTRSYEDDKLMHGVFTYYLLDGLKGSARGANGLITFNSLADVVTAKVKEFRPTQEPYTDGSFTGDFYLGGEFKAPPLAPPAAPTTSINLDLERFNAVKESRDSEFLLRMATELKDPQLAQLLRERAEAMRTALENKQPIAEPRTQEIADLRKQADALFDKKDYAGAYPLYQKLAGLGDAWGMLRVGRFLEGNLGVAQNLEAAAQWYAKAAEAGNTQAMGNLGYLYANGRGVKKDDAQAVNWYRKAAEAGEPLAMTRLGFMYGNGRGVAEDGVQAVAWYRKAAEAGEPLAMRNLGAMYEAGRGVEKDEVQAVAWYRKGAEGGDSGAQNNLGVAYENGRGIAKDDVQAAVWYRKAADAGDRNGMKNLGAMYAYGRGVAKDDVQAVAWYRKAAEAGEPMAMTNLGFMYAHGNGVAKDEVSAAAWYRKAADSGDPTGMKNLGVMYADGRGVGKDEVQAVAWYRKAADAGSALAMTNLGYMYEKGLGVTKDEVSGVAWYRKGAEGGDPTGMTDLGLMYENGHGVTKDDAQAAAWYEKSARAGDPRGMYRFARMLEVGRGTAKDLSQALVWYHKAADAGDQDATAAVKRLGQ